MHIHLLLVPSSLGQEENSGASLSPLRYVQAGIEQVLLDKDFTVTVERIHQDELHPDPQSASIAVNKKLAQAMKQALLAGEFPLVVSGMCDVSLGILAGFDHSHTGIVWFDAHGDFNTPETTRSGFFGGMPLAIVTGHCYQDLWAHVGNSTPIPETQTLLVGVRDLDPQERVRLEHSAISVVTIDELQQAEQTTEGTFALDASASRVQDVYLHLDIDVVDPQEAPGVDYPASGGPSAQEVEQAICTIAKHLPIKAAALTAYNPELDQEEKTLQVGLRLLTLLAESARSSAGNSLASRAT